MKLSVIVATFNRKRELQDLLASLATQTLPPVQFEVVVVDDGSSDGTNLFVETTIKKASFTIKYYYQQNKGPGKARNLGMERASGDVLIFIDSDCILPPEYLSTVHRAFEEQKIDAYGGPDRTAENFPAWDKAVNYTLTSFITTGGLRGSEGTTLARYYPRSFNMGFKRALYERIGGFGSIYQYGEDIEFSHRILESGARVAFLPDAYVYHKRRTNIRAFAKQIYKMGRARIQLARIDRKLLEPLHLVPSAVLVTAALLIIGSLLSEPVRTIAYVTAVPVVLLAVLLALHGLYRTGSLAGVVLIPLAFVIQVAAYGWGMIAEALFSGKKKP
jgi:glycosyltransferase involved in cell wall biosynthesis